MTFKEKLEHEYPIPFAASIFGDPKLADIEGFIKFCLADLQSDLEIYETEPAHGLQTQLPMDTRAVTSVKLDARFQGNKYVKFNFEPSTCVVTVRYIPAIIRYKRPVRLEDVDKLQGSRLQFLKAYTLEKMLSKEISYLTAIKLESTTGAIDVQALENARRKNEDLYKELKMDIMLYSGG